MKSMLQIMKAVLSNYISVLPQTLWMNAAAASVVVGEVLESDICTNFAPQLVVKLLSKTLLRAFGSN